MFHSRIWVYNLFNQNINKMNKQLRLLLINNYLFFYFLRMILQGSKHGGVSTVLICYKCISLLQNCARTWSHIEIIRVGVVA
jgi:hypothetical protein